MNGKILSKMIEDFHVISDEAIGTVIFFKFHFKLCNNNTMKRKKAYNQYHVITLSQYLTVFKNRKNENCGVINRVELLHNLK